MPLSAEELPDNVRPPPEIATTQELSGEKSTSEAMRENTKNAKVAIDTAAQRRAQRRKRFHGCAAISLNFEAPNARGGTRTLDRRIRNPELYPTELPAHAAIIRLKKSDLPTVKRRMAGP